MIFLYDSGFQIGVVLHIPPAPILPPPQDVWQCLETFLVVTTREDAAGNQ